MDTFVTKYEFELMYKRCIHDKTGLEPRGLFNLVQFLMYDKNNKGKIAVEDTLELLYVRYGRAELDNEIYAIFGDEEKTVFIPSKGRRLGKAYIIQGVPRKNAQKGLRKTQTDGTRTEEEVHQRRNKGKKGKVNEHHQ